MLDSVRKLFRKSAAPAPASAPAAGDPGVQQAAAPVASDSWKSRGNAALARGDVRAARAAYEEGTRESPENAVAWLNLAYTQLELTERDAARASLETAEALCRDEATLLDIWRLQGRERQEAREWAAARQHYEKVLEKAPSDALVLRELATTYRMTGEEQAAEEALVRALAAGGPSDLILLDLAWLTLQQGRLQDALGWIRRCISLHPGLGGAHLMCAKIQHKLGLREDALASVRRALELGKDPEAFTLAGRLLAEARNDLESLAFYDQALRLDGAYANALLGSVLPLMRLNRHDEAFARLDRILASGTDALAVHHARCLLFIDLGRFEQALEMLEGPLLPSVPGNAELEFTRAFSHLSLGRLERGWETFESRFRLPDLAGEWQIVALRPKLWRGEPLVGRSILLYPEQGFGDSIQMLRYLPMVAEKAGQVWLEVQAPLHPLLRELPPNCKLLKPGATAPDTDFTCPLFGLPAAFGTRMDTIPAPAAYLHATDAAVARWRERVGPRAPGVLRVGLAWSGNPSQVSDHKRSIPLALVREGVPEGIEFFSLQKEVRASDQAVAAGWGQLRHFGDELATFDDTAALAMQCDVVVSVCTSVAHLAGAMGRPLWVMLAHVPDWRWFLEREDSPWYPSARLFRQPGANDWATVLRTVHAELAQLRDRLPN